jgi:cytoskeleton protein RodZ
MADFGDKFRLARESSGLELEKVAQQTRISARFLRAIETEEFHVLPGGIFNRGFIRNYAELLGLDPEEAIAEYQELVREPTLEQSEPSQSPNLESPERHVLPIALGSLIVGIVLFYVFATDTRTPSEFAPMAPPIEAVGLDTPEVGTMATPDIPAPNIVNETVDPLEDLAPDLEPTEEPARTESDPPEPSAPVNEQIDGVSVRIDVHNDTWVAVHSDGQEIVQGIILSAGTTERYSAVEALEMTIGNAAGLTMSINGRPVPNLGRDGQVRTLRITPSNATRFTGS